MNSRKVSGNDRLLSLEEACLWNLQLFHAFPMFFVQQFTQFIVLQTRYIMNIEGVQNANSTANWTNTTANLTATDEVPSQSSLLVVQVFLGGISVSAFLGNGVVCVVIMRNREILTSAYNTFLFSLAVTDMLTGNRCEDSCLMVEKITSAWLIETKLVYQSFSDFIQMAQSPEAVL